MGRVTPFAEGMKLRRGGWEELRQRQKNQNPSGIRAGTMHSHCSHVALSYPEPLRKGNPTFLTKNLRNAVAPPGRPRCDSSG